MKVSIITVCFNSESTIENTIKSVLNQNYHDIEYIIVDGNSNDNTLKIIDKYGNKISKYISEDDLGIYDAMNKGLKISSGEIVGVLNSDDVFVDTNIISRIVSEFILNSQLDFVYGDVSFVDKSNYIIRKYSSSKWSDKKLSYGYMPAHPTFYCKKKLFHHFGFFRTDFKIAADFELITRFCTSTKLKYSYIPDVLVCMSIGGISTKGIRSTFIINREIKYACKLNSLRTNYFRLYLRYFKKLFEYI